jgi:hypothetical protein
LNPAVSTLPVAAGFFACYVPRKSLEQWAMATELLPVGTNAAVSPDFTLADGATANLFLKGEENGTAKDLIAIEIQDDAGGYAVIDYLGTGAFGRNVTGPGTFRVRRVDGMGKNVGVSRG